MYCPCFVFPYQRSPWQWYTFEVELTQTCPGPPPAAALAMWVLLSRLLVALPLSLAPRIVFVVAIAALLRFLVSLATPPWPRQAPRPAFADIVPSLHITPCEVAVTPVAGCAPTGEAVIHATAIDTAATTMAR